MCACIGCHLPHGLGHPENSRLAGTTAAYLTRQLADFKSGVRGGAGAGQMTKFSKELTDQEIHDATTYFASLKPKAWTKVVETDTVPKSYFNGTRRLQYSDGSTEPLGNRIIELPVDKEQVEMRSPHASFVSYVPVGSVAKGEALVTSGGGGKTLPCAICHGVGLKGLGGRCPISRAAPPGQYRAPDLLLPDRRPRRPVGRPDEGRGRESDGHRPRRGLITINLAEADDPSANANATRWANPTAR